MAKGIPLMGRGPDGKAKMINVDENGNVKVQQSGQMDQVIYREKAFNLDDTKWVGPLDVSGYEEVAIIIRNNRDDLIVLREVRVLSALTTATSDIIWQTDGDWFKAIPAGETLTLTSQDVRGLGMSKVGLRFYFWVPQNESVGRTIDVTVIGRKTGGKEHTPRVVPIAHRVGLVVPANTTVGRPFEPDAEYPWVLWTGNAADNGAVIVEDFPFVFVGVDSDASHSFNVRFQFKRSRTDVYQEPFNVLELVHTQRAQSGWIETGGKRLDVSIRNNDNVSHTYKLTLYGVR